MNKKSAEGYHIFSDVDGTLLMSPSIPEQNRRAIMQFIADGGLFSIATGRSRDRCRPIAKELSVNAPCILFDGAAIYDFDKEALLDLTPLPPDTAELVKIIVNLFPNFGVNISTMDDVFEVGSLQLEIPHYSDNLDYRGRVDEIPGEWAKIVLYSPDNTAGKFLERGNDLGLGELSVAASHDMFVNITANGCSKGAAMKKLREMGWGQSRSTVAVGDYDNDLIMLEQADFAACPDNAIPKIKAIADRVFCHANDGAVAQLIDYIRAL